ncbi:MAG TPA: prenyltransferase/squalene oxidase repeat-containing protein [Candidatus Acidoferrum sp.]|nr:prenyltransferase/squalene oxidase repeat-containing protein [Candidatus Acidoferrum sp.]
MRRRLVLALFGLVLIGGGAASAADWPTATSRGCRWLAAQQQPSGAIALRGRVLNPSVWETANALIALMRCDAKAYREVIAKGFAFLDANWIETGGLPESVDRRLGPHKSHCVETTGTALRAYAAAGKRAQAETLRKFLFSVQEPDGGWKIGYPEATTAFPNGDVLEVFPSVAGFALAATAVDPVDRSKAERGLQWLTARQQPDGDWGAYPDYFWTPYYATSQIVAAFAGWGRRDDPVVKRALRFTRDHQNADGSWGDAGEPLTPSRELWTALALQTLEAAVDAASRPAIDRGIAYLLSRQQADGRWIGGHFKSVVVDDSEKKEDVYVTSLAVVALLQYSPRAGRR